MKLRIILTWILFTLQGTAIAQCGINYKKVLEENCLGVYMLHDEIHTSNNVIQLGLEANSSFSMYLLNANHKMPKVEYRGNKAISFSDYDIRTDSLKKIEVHRFTAANTGQFEFNFDFKDDHSCALLALFLNDQNNLKPGFYLNFEELKYNHPSKAFAYTIKTKEERYSHNNVHISSIKTSRTDRRSIGKVIGFCDGKNIYTNDQYSKLRSNSEFYKVEDLGKYYYYTIKVQTPIITNNITTFIITGVEKIMDKNTGEVMVLSVRNLKKIMENDVELLDQFLSEKRKNQKLKTFLIHYIDRNYI